MFPFQLPGGSELIVIAIIFIILFGGGKAISSAKKLGKDVSELKKNVDDIKDEVKMDKVDILKIIDKD